MTSATSMIAVRSSRDISLQKYEAGKACLIHTTAKSGSAPMQCRVMKFTSDGKCFAFCDGENVKVMSAESSAVKELFSFPLPKTSAIHFSPRSSFICTFETLTTSVASTKAKKTPIMDIRYRCEKHVGIPNTECPCAKKTDTVRKGEFVETFVNTNEPEPEEETPETEADATVNNQKTAKTNVKVWSLVDGSLAFEYSCKKQSDWEPQWSSNEEVVARIDGSEIRFYERADLNRFVHKLVLPKVTKYSISCGPEPYHIACYVPEVKGTPASVRLFLYPDFKDIYKAVANKSFFNADRVSMKWNPKGTGLTFMAIADVDKSGASYYGEQHLYLMLTNGESFKVPLAKLGPVYDFQWNPNSAEFAVVYGLMPAKATLYNLKGEATFDFGTGPRNEVHYSPFGNVLCICGFGNLKGKVEFWSVKDRKQICETMAEDTTSFEWAADGEHFLTATTAPRLRVNNGWKVWSYHSGNPLLEVKAEGYELFEVCWRPQLVDAEKLRNPPPIHWDKAAAVEKIVAKVDAATGKPKGAYVAPHLRGNPQGAAKFQLHEDELPQNLKEQRKIEESSGKNQKKKHPAQNAPASSKPSDNISQKKPGQQDLSSAEQRGKKIMTLNKKLGDIEKLKQKLAEGVKLEANQLEKMSKEEELLEELRILEL